MKTMGLRHGMAFDQFIEIVCKADPDLMDNHVRPQAEIAIRQQIGAEIHRSNGTYDGPLEALTPPDETGGSSDTRGYSTEKRPS